jgi:hypothetical protein
VLNGSLDGQGWSELFHPDDDKRVRAHWKKTLETGDLYKIEYRLKSHAGEILLVSLPGIADARRDGPHYQLVRHLY